MSKQEFTLELLNECFSLNEGTGALTWRKRPREHFKNEQAFKAWNTKYAGKESGFPGGDGYLRTRINGERYQTHRLIFQMHHCTIPGGQIDHINRVKTDNRPSNLRIVSNAENARNQRLRRNNSSGTCGVYRDERRGKWAAQVFLDGKCVNLGRYDFKPDAEFVSCVTRRVFGYSPGHGDAS